jgi:hypothetical protein
VGASRIIEAAGRQQHQRRAQPLAAAVDDVFGDLADQHHVGIQALADDMVDGEHVVGQIGLQALQGHDSGLLLNKPAMVAAPPAFFTAMVSSPCFIK